MLILPPPCRGVSPSVCRCRTIDWSYVLQSPGGPQPIRRFHSKDFFPGLKRILSHRLRSFSTHARRMSSAEDGRRQGADGRRRGGSLRRVASPKLLLSSSLSRIPSPDYDPRMDSDSITVAHSPDSDDAFMFY